MVIIIRKIVFLIVAFMQLIGSEYQEEERDATFNARIAQSHDCVYIGADYTLNEKKNISISLLQQSCDEFTNESELAFEMSKRVAVGALWFLNSAFEDSFFVGVHTGPREKEIITYKKSHSDIYLWRNDLTFGYQWHYESGFIVAFGYGFSGESVLYSSAKISEDENQKTEDEIKRLTRGREFDSNYIFLIGWRF